MKKIYRQIILLLIICFYGESYSQSSKFKWQDIHPDKSKEEVPKNLGKQKLRQLLDSAYSIRQIDLSQYLKVCEAANLLALCQKNEKAIAKCNSYKAYYYKQIGESDKAITYYYKSLKQYENQKDVGSMADIYSSLGILYDNNTEYKKSLKYSLKALSLYNTISYERGIAKQYTNIGNTYAQLNKIDSCRHYYTNSIALYKKINYLNNLSTLQMNLGTLDMREAKYEQANTKFLEALSLLEVYPNPHEYSLILMNLCYVSMALKKEYLSNKYLKELDSIVKDLKDYRIKLQCLDLRVNLYELKGDKEKQIKYLKEYIEAKDSIFSLKREELKQEIETKYNLEKIQERNKVQKQQLSNRVKINILILIIAVLISLLIYTYQKRKRKDEKAKSQEKHDQLKGKIEEEICKSKKVEESVQYQDKEITNMSLHLLQKNKLINDLEKILKDISKNIDDEAKKKEIEINLVSLKQLIIAQNELEDYNLMADEANRKFIQRLKSMYSVLTDKDIQLAVYIRMGLSSKEISNINSISEQAVKTARYRFRKKIELDNKLNLTSFLRDI